MQWARPGRPGAGWGGGACCRQRAHARSHALARARTRTRARTYATVTACTRAHAHSNTRFPVPVTRSNGFLWRLRGAMVSCGGYAEQRFAMAKARAPRHRHPTSTAPRTLHVRAGEWGSVPIRVGPALRPSRRSSFPTRARPVPRRRRFLNSDCTACSPPPPHGPPSPGVPGVRVGRDSESRGGGANITREGLCRPAEPAAGKPLPSESAHGRPPRQIPPPAPLGPAPASGPAGTVPASDRQSANAPPSPSVAIHTHTAGPARPGPAIRVGPAWRLRPTAVPGPGRLPRTARPTRSDPPGPRHGARGGDGEGSERLGPGRRRRRAWRGHVRQCRAGGGWCK
jgi:hypothetical protein